MKEENSIQSFDELKPSSLQINDDENKEKEKEKKPFKFPSAYSVILIVQVFVFILTFIIPKGKYAIIFYVNGSFTYTYPNGAQKILPADQETLETLKLKIEIENFENGNIKKAIAIPGTYEKVKGHKTNIFDLFLYLVLGMINLADIEFFLMILEGNINVLIEMKALTNGLQALVKKLKLRGFILLCKTQILVSIGI